MANAAGSFKKPDPTSFTWAETDEPHATRRQLILQKYPQIRELFVTEPLTFVIVCGIFTIQITTAYLIRNQPIWLVLICAYVIGGTLNHSLQLASHELSHNLCWSSITMNKLTAIFSNFVTGFPSSITFQRYHMDHHQYQGVDEIDTDIPSSFETNNFVNTAAKTFWLFLNPIWYAFRPLFYKPKPLSLWEIINWIAQLTFNITIIYTLGVQPMVYLVTGTLLGLGLHPAAGHFIAEHYEFVRGQETYSYYGPLNYVNFNVGYHNEHHDFPRIPWSKLPLVKQIAPEFYDLPSYSSYITVMYNFITDATVGPWSRIKRAQPDSVAKIEMKKANQQKTLSEQSFKYVASTLMAAVILYSIAHFMSLF